MWAISCPVVKIYSHLACWPDADSPTLIAVGRAVTTRKFEPCVCQRERIRVGMVSRATLPPHLLVSVTERHKDERKEDQHIVQVVLGARRTGCIAGDRVTVEPSLVLPRI